MRAAAAGRPSMSPWMRLTAATRGTKARLALGLLLYTAQRRGDVVAMGRQHERGGFLAIVQDKTGTPVEIPIHPELRAIIEATPSGHLTYLVTEFGKPFTPAGFGNWFAERVSEAGLPERCRAHGLRKAACRRLAEAGCTAPQISAISGHLSLREVQPYIDAANRSLMAAEGMAKVAQAFPVSQTTITGLRKTGKTPRKSMSTISSWRPRLDSNQRPPA